MRRYIVVGDIHSDFKALGRALTRVSFDPNNDTLICLGDMFDRGDETLELFSFLNSLPHKILIYGNHEQLLLEALKNRSISNTDIHNGTAKTIAALSGKDVNEINIRYDLEAIDCARNSGIVEWINNNTQYYYETPHYIFCHAWLPITGLFNYNLGASNADWEEAVWSRVPDMIRAHRVIYPTGWDKTIVVGHWGTDLLRKEFDKGSFKVQNWTGLKFEDKQHKIICLDSTTAATHFIDPLVIEEKDI